MDTHLQHTKNLSVENIFQKDILLYCLSHRGQNITIVILEKGKVKVQPYSVVGWLCQWSPLSPLVCNIQRCSGVASNPCSASPHGNTASSEVVKGTLGRTFEKEEYALCISMLVGAPPTKSQATRLFMFKLKYQWYWLNSYMCTISWCMAIPSQDLISQFEKQKFHRVVCGHGLTDVSIHTRVRD